MKNKLYLIEARRSDSKTEITITRSNRGRRRYEPASASLRRLEKYFEVETEIFLMETAITLIRHLY